jgi:putative aldouronate transport system permease protein
MAAPGFLYLLINNYLPMIGLSIAFKNIDYSIGILQSPWNGFENFKYLFSTSDAFTITRNTLCYNGFFILINTVLAVAVAILLNEIRNKTLLKTYQSMILLPYLISMIIVAYIVYAGLSADTGFMNKGILPALGMKPVDWYSETKYWPLILSLVNVWKNVGYLCIIFLASIIGIDEAYYEAAKLDGATRWQQIKTITLPMIQSVVTIMVLLAVGRIFYSDFGLFYQVPMNSGPLYPVTNVIDTYVYRGLLQLGDIGMASAAGMYQSVVGFVLVMISNMIVRKINPENALF